MMIRERGASERKKREREERERREAGRENRAEKKKGERKRAEEKRERFQQQIDRGLRARPHRAPTARRHDVCRRPPPEGKNSFPSPLSLSHACLTLPVHLPGADSNLPMHTQCRRLKTLHHSIPPTCHRDRCAGHRKRPAQETLRPRRLHHAAAQGHAGPQDLR